MSTRVSAAPNKEGKELPAPEGEEKEEEKRTAAAATTATATATAPPQKKRPRISPPSSRGTSPHPSQQTYTPAFLVAASQAVNAASLVCLTSLVTRASLPSIEQITAAANKTYLLDAPPYVHLSKSDSAPQLKVTHFAVQGGMRGYRMSRASHGVSEGCYYYEVLVQQPPSATEIVNILPPTVRLAKKLQKQLDEELSQTKHGASLENKRKPSVGGHLRLGWAMRTGDLQAPVGYDKWSFGIRDIGGSRIHASMREDDWGGEGFLPGDVVGLCVSLEEEDDRHIRFFKNGQAMGRFEIIKGKRRGGAAFDNIPEGTYYPAISVYMGGTCKVNFGPHFTYPPRMLPTGLKVKPMSEVVADPPAPDEVVQAIKLPKKTEENVLQAFRDVVRAEAQIRFDAHQKRMREHVEEIRAAREKNGLSTSDLPSSTVEKTPIVATSSSLV